MNCIIIDDDQTARLIIRNHCIQTNKIVVLEEFSSAIEAIKYLNSTKVDLVYLDIHMPTFSGFDFIETLKDLPKIVLTTSDQSLALAAFEYKSVVDYLVKPITKERFNKSLEKIEALDFKKNTASDITIQSDSLFVSVDKRLVKINISDIYLIEAKGDYINIKTDQRNYIVHATLKKIEEKLPPLNFFKAHRSFIINTNEIIDIEDNTVLIRKDVIPVSRSNKSELMNKLNLL
ncbi:LytR/AlgR family response regulator transcription factor [Polaribacter sp.]|uniref:LytR/AlgR family response regulator transcription factor n=1 Tax=Polaribacter sp. TaxID=1920175 RepID=UPI003F6A0F89